MSKRTSKIFPINPNILGYAAGMIDGEGSIMITRMRNRSNNIRYRTATAIVMTNIQPLLFLQKHFGGWVGKAGRIRLPNKHKPAFKWILSNNACVPFLKQVSPFLLVKQKQAKLALRFSKSLPGTNGKNTPVKTLTLQKNLRNRIQKLNRRGL